MFVVCIPVCACSVLLSLIFLVFFFLSAIVASVFEGIWASQAARSSFFPGAPPFLVNGEINKFQLLHLLLWLLSLPLSL